MKKLMRVSLGSLALIVLLSSQTVDVYKWPLQVERDRDFDFIHYLIRLDIDIPGKTFQGRTTATVQPLRDGRDTVVLDAEEFTVKEVLGEQGEPLAFEQIPGRVTVRLGQDFRHDQRTSFTVAYEGRDPKDGLRFFDASAERPAMVASNSWPYGVRHWLPCYDYPNDKATSEIIATVAAGNKVVANGRLLARSEDKTAGTVTYHWLQDKPHSTYLIFLAAAPYTVVEDRLGAVPINYWVYPRQAGDARRTYGKTPEMMTYFNSLFGYNYPWDKYDQVEVPFGGGMESTSNTAMGEGVIIDERAEIDFPSLGIVSHELAHQWWGDLVTLRTWSEVWINESTATYCDYLYLNHALGPDEGALELLKKKNAYLQEAREQYIRPIVFDRYGKPQDVFDSHSYPKGALVLHMLRAILGDDAFFRTLSAFLHENEFRAVDTHDFSKAVKETTGRNLDWFLEQWLYKPGHPIVEVASNWDEATAVVRLRVKQVQDTSKGIPIYRMPVKIGVTTAEGTNVHQVWINDEDETFEFRTSSRPLLVRFDQDNVLLKEMNFPRSREELLFQLGKDDVIGRMEAASELVRFGKEKGVQDALRATAGNDSFWAVREGAVQALGRIGDPALLPFLKQRCADVHPRVRTAALSALGEFRQPGLAGFFKKHFQQERSYRAQAEALKALGKTGDRSAEAFLKDAEKTPSFRNIIQRAAREALKSVSPGKS
jgi:aminopeptidase N